MGILIASAATSTQLAPSNYSRSFAAVENTDTNALYLLVGPGTASATNYTVSLSSGDYYELPRFVAGMEINGVWAADGTGGAMVTTI